MTRILPLLAIAGSLGLAAHAAQARDYTALFADQGIAGTIDALSGLTDPTPSDQFALGAARFLGAMEFSLQERYRTGLGDQAFSLTGTAILALNPNPEPFQPSDLNTYLDTMIENLSAASATLEEIKDSDDVVVEIDTSRLWLDINANGVQEPGEELISVMLPMFVNSWQMEETLAMMDEAGGPPSVTFDTADAAWLAAYAHVIAGSAEFLYAFDPATTVELIMEREATIDTLRGAPEASFLFDGEGDAAFLNFFSIFTEVIETQPDPQRTRAALGHLQAMIANNKVFWARVEAETDNTAEWIPNDRQTSALPLNFPEGVGDSWQKVLADVEAVLNGELLVPHWRLGTTAGIDLNAWMNDPAPLDIMGVIHGFALEPYMRRGRVISETSFDDFNRMTDRNFGLFAFTLN